jgi:PKD repeat protein
MPPLKSGLILVVLLLVSGCGSFRQVAQVPAGGAAAGPPGASADLLPPVPSTAGTAAGFPLPGLVEIRALLDSGRVGAFTAAEGHRNGAEFEALLYRTNVVADGDNATYTPAFEPPGAALSGLAAAIYSFDLPDYDGSPVSLELQWVSRPPDGDVYVGLGDWVHGRWEWLVVPPESALVYNYDFSPFIDGTDVCVLAVVVMGTGEYTLQALQLTMLEVPHAVLAAYPTLGLASLPVQFCAWDSIDPDGTIELYEWDFDGDGTYDESGPQDYTSHVYDAEGFYTASVRVTDDDGLTAGDAVLVTVTQPEGWRLEVPVRDVPMLIRGFSAAVVDGKPAVAFSSYNDVRYCQAADEAGDAWNAWMTVQADTNTGGALALAVVRGRPAIAYADVNGEGPLYTRAFHADGTAWASPQPAAALTDLGQVQLIETTSNKPVVAASVLSDAGNSVQVMLALDDAGQDWLAPIVADSGDDTGHFNPVLKLVSSEPALAYADSFDVPCYSPSSGIPDGHDWVDETRLISPGSWAGPYLADVNGHPALAYAEWNDHDLVYLRADDVGGTSWPGDALPDPAASLRYGAALACIAIAGVPVIAYSVVAPGGEDDELRFVRALDEDGAAWEAAQVIGVWDSLGGIEVLELSDGRPAIVFRAHFDGPDPGEALYFAVEE